MIVELIKNYELHPGNWKRKGQRLDVLPEFGRELIRKKVAKQIHPKGSFENVTKYL